MSKKPTNAREARKKTSAKPPLLQQPEFKRRVNYEFLLPTSFLLLCRLMEVEPSRVLSDFMEDMGRVSWNKEGRERSRELLGAYFLERGYGGKFFNPDDIRQILKEMEAIHMLYPEHADEELLQLHAEWREKYEEYWFRKWYSRLNRTL